MSQVNGPTSRALILGLALVCAATFVVRAQGNPDADHARRVLDLLEHQKFDEVATEFNAQVAAVMSAAQLRDAWTAVHGQVGALSAIIGQETRKPSPSVTAVILGCQFEKATLNVVIAFDADGKIGGLRFVPRPSPEPPAAPPASARFREEAVTVGEGEWALPGTLSMPVDAIAASIVLVHGSGPEDRDETIGANKPFRDLAWGLADRGIAVLRYEKRTRQYPAKVAAIKQLTVQEEVIDDAVLAAALLRSRDRLASKPVFLLGHSLGGTLAPRIAAQDRSLAGLVILAGATRSILDAARDQLTYLASLSPNANVRIEDALQSLRHAAPESYWKDLDAYKPAQTAATLSIPMLILQGERDYQVTLEDLKGWRTALAGHANVTIKTYPTLNHLFLAGEGKSTPAEYERPGHIPDMVLDDIAGWIKKQ